MSQVKKMYTPDPVPYLHEQASIMREVMKRTDPQSYVKGKSPDEEYAKQRFILDHWGRKENPPPGSFRSASEMYVSPAKALGSGYMGIGYSSGK